MHHTDLRLIRRSRDIIKTEHREKKWHKGLTSIFVKTDEAVSRFAGPFVNIFSISIAQQGALGEASLGVAVVTVVARGGVVAVIATRS